MKKNIITTLIFATLLLTAGCSNETESSSSQAETSAEDTTISSVETVAETEEITTTTAAEAASEAEKIETTVAAATDASATTVAVTTTATATTTSAQSDNELVATGSDEIKSGVWLAVGAGESRYIIFNSDEPSGSILSVETKTGVAFTYEHDDDKTIFYIGTVDNRAPGLIKLTTDENHAKIIWDEGIQEELTYISNDDADKFEFYSNDELCEMALKYYATVSGEDTSDMQTGIETNEDGTVSIQVYSNLGDHNSTADWYTVDRITATGTNNANEAIDLK